MKKYSEAMFQSDLADLEKLVGNYNATGGKSGKRSFRVVECDGKPVKVGSRMAGRYHINIKTQNPSDAASKAYSALCNKMGKKNAGCRCTFTLKETTRGSISQVQSLMNTL